MKEIKRTTSLWTLWFLWTCLGKIYLPSITLYQMKLETKYMLFGLVLKVLESSLTSCGLFYLKIHAAGIKPLSVLDFVLMKIGSVRFVITHSWCMLVFRMCDNKSNTFEPPSLQCSICLIETTFVTLPGIFLPGSILTLQGLKFYFLY